MTPTNRNRAFQFSLAWLVFWTFVCAIVAAIARLFIESGKEGWGYFLCFAALGLWLAAPWLAGLANVRGARPETVEYAGSAAKLRDVWIAMRANLRAVLEELTLADVASGELPAEIVAITADPDAWEPH